jgi:hypothetical protein
MNALVILLFAFVLIGLASDRLGRAAYPLMGVVIFTYVAYAYTHSV